MEVQEVTPSTANVAAMLLKEIQAMMNYLARTARTLSLEEMVMTSFLVIQGQR
jgi:hypothetical protein